MARRGDAELRVEVKGVTKDKGTDADTAYGQILRRVVADSRVQYAVVGPTACMEALKRVPAFVRWRLGIGLYEVTDDGQVVEHDRPVGSMAKTDRGAAFDPCMFGVLVRPTPTLLEPRENDFVFRWTAYVVPLLPDESAGELDDWDLPRAVAEIAWEHAAFGEAMNARWDLFLVADDHSAALSHIYSTIYNEDGDAREHFIEGAAAGNDLLHIESVYVEPGFDFGALARWMIEYVIERFTGGCGFVAYYSDEVPHVALRSALLERGFEFQRDPPIYVLNLAHKRPALPGREEAEE